MITLDVKFNGKEYKIRRNMYTLNLFQKEFKKLDEDSDQSESLVAFAWAALKGYNKDFKLSTEDVAMDLDDPKNQDFLESVTKILQPEEAKESEEDVEKK